MMIELEKSIMTALENTHYSSEVLVSENKKYSVPIEHKQEVLMTGLVKKFVDNGKPEFTRINTDDPNVKRLKLELFIFTPSKLIEFIEVVSKIALDNQHILKFKVSEENNDSS